MTRHLAAGDLTLDDIGKDLTLTIGAMRTGGTINSIRVDPIFGRVLIELDGQVFNVEAGKLVTVAAFRAPVLARC